MAIALIVIGFLCTLPAACLIGAIKGTIDGCKLVAEEKRQQVRDRAIAAGEITHTLELPPDIADKLQALEYSADVTRKEISVLNAQMTGIYDQTETIKIEKKIASAYKRLSSDYEKINKIKNKYGMY